MLKTPYLLFLGDAPDQLAAKTAQGVRDWRPEFALGQMRPCQLQGGIWACPRWTSLKAGEAGARTLIIGAANRGGVDVRRVDADPYRGAGEGFSTSPLGLHDRLQDRPELVAAAKASGTRLVDSAHAPEQVSHCQWRGTQGQTIAGRRHRLFGRQDVHRARHGKGDALSKGMNATLPRHRPDRHPDHRIGRCRSMPWSPISWPARSSGLTPGNDDNHWEPDRRAGKPLPPLLSPASPLALIHGGRPDAAGCSAMSRRAPICAGLPHYKLPSLEAGCAICPWKRPRIVNPDVRVTGVSVNTAAMSDADARAYLAEGRGPHGPARRRSLPPRRGAARRGALTFACRRRWVAAKGERDIVPSNNNLEEIHMNPSGQIAIITGG